MGGRLDASTSSQRLAQNMSGGRRELLRIVVGQVEFGPYTNNLMEGKGPDVGTFP